MKNVAIVLLLAAVAVLMGAKHQDPVTSISFDGGKTRLHGDVVFEVNEYNGAGAPSMFADVNGNTVRIHLYAPLPPQPPIKSE